MQSSSYAARRRARIDDELTLSSHVALAIISRAIRPMLKRSRRFVASLVLDDQANHGAFRVAGLRVLDKPKAADELDFANSFDVISIDTVEDAASQLGKLRYCERAIVLLKHKDLVTDELIAASDVVVAIPPPTGADFMIAAWRMGFGRISREDAAFLATQDLGRVSLAFRIGRSANAVIGRLRRLNTPGEQSASTPETAVPRLEELSGYGEAMVWGMDLAQDLADWKTGKLDWSAIDRGVLISGQPGSGKTQFASALAQSCGAAFVATSAAQWQSHGHLGDMLKAMRRSFNEARKESPTILFIDEFDSIGDRASASGDNASYQRQVINALLECVDGAQELEGVVVVGATNFPELIDPALLRPGRLERQFEIKMPDAVTRADIFRFHLGIDLLDADLGEPAKWSEGWSGADIAKCVRSARRVARRGKRPLTMADLMAAMPERNPIPLDVLKMVAVHEAGHAIVGVMVEADRLQSVTISETVSSAIRTQSLGGTLFEERLFERRTSTFFDNKIAVLLAGMAAERLVFGEHTNGSGGHMESDLVRATELATMMEVKWGFGSMISSQAAERTGELERLRDVRPRLAQDVEARLKAQYKRVEKMLSERIGVLRKVSDALVRQQSLTGDEVRQIVFGSHRSIKELAIDLSNDVFN